MEAFLLAKNPFPVTVPNSGHLDLPSGRFTSLHGLASAAKHGEQGFNAMHAVPKKVGMMRLKLARTVRFSIEHLAYSTISSSLGISSKPQRGGAEDRHVLFFSESKDSDHVFQRGSHWLINV